MAEYRLAMAAAWRVTDRVPHYPIPEVIAAWKDHGLIDEFRAGLLDAWRDHGLDAATGTRVGDLLRRSDDPDGAIAFYREAVRLKPEAALRPRVGICMALRQKGDLDAALAAGHELVRDYPGNGRAHAQLGWTHLARKKYDRAAACYAEVVRFLPGNAQFRYEYGLILQNKGDLNGAIASFMEAVRLDPEHAAAHNLLAWVLAAGPDGVRDARPAVHHATRACELSSWKAPHIIDTLAAAYAAAGDCDKAVEYQRQALSLQGFEKSDRPEMRARLDLYAQGMPYYAPEFAPREVAPPPREVKR